jgi:hypothetical protein
MTTNCSYINRSTVTRKQHLLPLLHNTWHKHYIVKNSDMLHLGMLTCQFIAHGVPTSNSYNLYFEASDVPGLPQKGFICCSTRRYTIAVFSSSCGKSLVWVVYECRNSHLAEAGGRGQPIASAGTDSVSRKEAAFASSSGRNRGRRLLVLGGSQFESWLWRLLTIPAK